MDAEIAYLFRHALLRDAAYDLQLPELRAALHRSALDILEEIYGGLPPDPKSVYDDGSAYTPLPIDDVAAELAEHAEWAARGAEPPPELQQRRRIYLKRAAIRAAHTFQNLDSARLWMRAAELMQGNDRASALRNAANLQSAAGHAGEGEKLIRQALAIVDVPGQTGALLPQCLLLFGHLCGTDERMDEAEQAYRRALELSERQGHPNLCTSLKIRLGFVLNRAKRLEEATRYYELALHESRERQDERTEALAVAGLAGVAASAGQYAEADKLYEQALAMNRAQGDRRGESTTLGNMASYLWMSRQYQRGEEAIRAVLPLHREVGNRRFEAKALGGLASSALMHNQPEQALALAQQALEIDREVGNRIEEALHLCTIGRCLIALNRLQSAEEHWRKGIAQLREVNVPPMISYALSMMREACQKHGLAPFE